MGNIFLRFLLRYSNVCTISIMDMIVVPSELLVDKIKRIILHLIIQDQTDNNEEKALAIVY